MRNPPVSSISLSLSLSLSLCVSSLILVKIVPVLAPDSSDPNESEASDKQILLRYPDQSLDSVKKKRVMAAQTDRARSTHVD